MQNILPVYPVKHLFLLVGTNPLPNYVVARLLADANTHIYLVHSSATELVALRVAYSLELEYSQYTQLFVNEADPSSIYRVINQRAQQKTGIALDYTGGTKVMAVHACQAMVDLQGDALFSYLDARRLDLVLHDHERHLLRRYVGDSVSMSIKKLAQLHDISSVNLKRKPIQAELCQSFANMQRSNEENTAWRNWAFVDNCEFLPSGAMFADVLSAMKRVCNDNGCELNEGSLATAMGYQKYSSLISWFQGEWLESYTLDCILRLSRQGKIGFLCDWGINIVCSDYAQCTAIGLKFELDVAFIMGYQLFAVSCITSHNKERCKEHLFEAYIRSRQMGGDEAMVCLVSGYNNPDDLQKEVEKSWDAKGRIRVLGACHWPDLSSWLEEWINTGHVFTRDPGLSSIDHMAGSCPDICGNLSASEYIRRLRDEN